VEAGAAASNVTVDSGGLDYLGIDPTYSGADAVLSEGRYCIGSTGAEFLRISK
jgi:hypothetical protein